jgi:hypothetical protein
MCQLAPACLRYYSESDDDVIALVHADRTIVGFARGELMLSDEPDPDKILARDHSTVARAKFSDPVAAAYTGPPQDRSPVFDLIEVEEDALHPRAVRVDDLGGQPAERVGGCNVAAHSAEEEEAEGREKREVSTGKRHLDVES